MDPQILIEIQAEQRRAKRLHPDFKIGTDSIRSFKVLDREVGEVAQAIMGADAVNLHEELVQVASVALLWLEYMRHPDKPRVEKKEVIASIPTVFGEVK